MATQAIPRVDVSPVQGPSVKRQATLINFLTYVLLALGAAIVLVPFWWMVLACSASSGMSPCHK